MAATTTNAAAPRPAAPAPAVAVAPVKSSTATSNAASGPAWSITENSAAPAPELGQIPLTAFAPRETMTESDLLKKYKVALDLAREQRAQKSLTLAAQTLADLLTNQSVPMEIKRQALFESALTAQDDGKFVRAEQIFGQYLHLFPDDPSTPEIMLRQGLIYRQMGVNNLAISKFYAVMSSALKLKLESMDYYKKIVLQSQMEIADTYYLEGRYEDSADFFNRLLKSPSADLNVVQTHYKLIRSLSYLTNYADTVSQSQIFLSLHPNAMEVPEVRFVLASALKKLGHNNDSMKQVLLLLQSQAANVKKNPELWTYWQQKAGNEIANQLYKEGDYLNALEIYLSLAELDKSPGWQLPAWYQTGLVYEQLQQWPKASEMYKRIVDRKKELTDATSTPSLLSLIDMAKWRNDYIAWMQKAKGAQESYVLNERTNSTAKSNNTP